MMRLRHGLILILLILLMLLAGCGAPTPEDIPPPGDIVDRAVVATREADNFRLIIERSGAPVYIDSVSAFPGFIEFIRAEGDFVLPDRLQVTVKVGILTASSDRETAPTSTGEFIAIAEQQYLSHALLTGGRWNQYTFLPGFNPETLLSEGGGLERALGSVKDLTLVGVENRDGAQAYHLRGTGSGPDVSAFTLGLVGGEDVEVDAWVEVETDRVIRIEIVEPDRPRPEDQAEPPRWVVELYDYNRDGLSIGVPEDAVEVAPTATPNPAGSIAP